MNVLIFQKLVWKFLSVEYKNRRYIYTYKMLEIQKCYCIIIKETFYYIRKKEIIYILNFYYLR